MKDIPHLVRSARDLRERLWVDPHRPRYHFVPPDGWFNDANGTLFWNGRYHIFYLARSPIPDPGKPDEEKWVEVWDHASSRDLVHWRIHPPAVTPSSDGSTPRGMWSGDAIENAPRPALVYHVPTQGTCVSVSDGEEQTAVVYRPVEQTLTVDVGRSTLDSRVRYALRRDGDQWTFTHEQTAPLELPQDEPLQLRLFIDRSVLEVFANGRQCITQRIYPTRPDSLRVRVFARGGGATVRSVEAWTIDPTNSW